MAGAKKKAACRGAAIVFLDESGFSERPPVRSTWAPRGQTPVLTHRFGRWGQLSAIGALSYPTSVRRRPRVFLWLRRGTLRSAQVVRFLRHLRRHQRGPVLLLWDGLNTHRSRETRAHLDAQRHWLEVHRLPPYAPELNPVESLWGWFKGPAGTAHLCPDSLEPLARELRQARRRLGRRSAVLDGFLHRTGLFFAA